MPRYRVLRDFGSHLGNHYRGEQLALPDGDLPRGFAGFVELVSPPQSETKDVRPEAGDPPAPAQSAADPSPPAADDAAPPEPDVPHTPADQARAGYSDKMVRPRKRP
jgi:hypothetical protein